MGSFMSNKADRQHANSDAHPNDAYHDNQNTILIENPRADLSFGNDNTYNAGGLKRSLHGTIFQLRLIMLFVLRAMDKRYEFCLATEIDAAEKFDDIVLKYITSDRKALRFVQAKHKKDVDKNKITFSALTSNNNDFSLQKYFISYCKIKHNILFKDADLQDFLIVTNIDFDQNERTKKKVRGKFKSLETWKNLFEPKSDLDMDVILHSFKAVKYKFKHSAVLILKERFQRNLLDSALESGQIHAGSAVREKLNSLKSLHFGKLIHETTSTATENIQNEYAAARRKTHILSEATKVLQRKSDICKTEEFKDLKEAADILEKTPAKGKKKNLTNLTRALENVRDKVEYASRKAQNDLENSESILAKYKDRKSKEFERLDAEKTKLSSDQFHLRQLIDRISDATSLEPIKLEIEAEISAGRILKTIFDEYQKDNMEFDALKDTLIKKFEKIITDISIVQVAINDDTFESCFDEFIAKFTIVAKFPNEEELNKHIMAELHGQFDLLSANLVSDSFQREILDFFKFYQDGKARGYSSTDAERFFSDMRRQESAMLDKVIRMIDDNRNISTLTDHNKGAISEQNVCFAYNQ